MSISIRGMDVHIIRRGFWVVYKDMLWRRHYTRVRILEDGEFYHLATSISCMCFSHTDPRDHLHTELLASFSVMNI